MDVSPKSKALRASASTGRMAAMCHKAALSGKVRLQQAHARAKLIAAASRFTASPVEEAPASLKERDLNKNMWV